MRTLYVSLMFFVLFFGTLVGVFALEYTGSLRVTQVDDTALSLSWDEQTQASGYIIYYDYTDTLDPEDPQYFEQSDPVTLTTTTIENLEPDAHYSFVVAALDKDGNESTNTSNQVTVKTLAKRPELGLKDVPVEVLESKKILVHFTRVLDLEKPHEVKIINLDSANQSSVLVNGYLAGTQDLRTLQVFLSEPLIQGNSYRLEVIQLQDNYENQIGENETKIKEFIANYEEEKVAVDGESEEVEQEPEYEAPVQIDTLPVTGPKEIALLIMLIFVGMVSYVFFRFRRT